ncbi:MAG: hypothetical protein IBX72_13855 [Nitrospirae bacterium]|nr:hypothetical protein [Nitrospirota bacterium]
MINKRDINLELSIRFTTPFIVGSGFGKGGLVDSTTVKGNNNIVYLPGSSIKGRIKSEFKKNMEMLYPGSICNSLISRRTEICKQQDIKNACAICRIFGSEFCEGSLIFEDAVIEERIRDILHKIEGNKVIPLFQSSIRTGIRLNRFLKTAEEGALFTLEGVNPAIVLTSRIYGSCYISDDECSYLKEVIKTITHLGGNKARGMGRCSVDVREVTP